MGGVFTTMSVSPEQMVRMRAVARLRCGKPVPKLAVDYFLKIFESSITGDEKVKYELIVEKDLALIEQKKKNMGLI
jgi:hypothetical protein